MKMEQTECSETSEYKIQMPGNYPEESIQHSVHSESLKSRIKLTCCLHLQGKLFYPEHEVADPSECPYLSM